MKQDFGATPARPSGRLQEIRERWSKATPGPWHADVSDPGDAVVWAGDAKPDQLLFNVGDQVSVVGCSCLNEVANCEAIAAAPTDIAYLLAEVERLSGATPAAGGPNDFALYDGWFASVIADLRAGKLLSESRPVDEWLEESRNTLRQLHSKNVGAPAMRAGGPPRSKAPSDPSEEAARAAESALPTLDLSDGVESRREAVATALRAAYEVDYPAEWWSEVARDPHGFVRTQEEWDKVTAYARELRAQVERSGGPPPDQGREPSEEAVDAFISTYRFDLGRERIGIGPADPAQRWHLRRWIAAAYAVDFPSVPSDAPTDQEGA